MTKFQEKQLAEMNQILQLCYQTYVKKREIERVMDKHRHLVSYRLQHLRDAGLITMCGDRNTSCYFARFKEYPREEYELFCYEASNKHLETKLKNNPKVETQPAVKTTLGDARYVHKMEDYADKYKEQTKRARQEYVRKPVFVGNLWSAIV